jgi:hypothetical protein
LRRPRSSSALRWPWRCCSMKRERGWTTGGSTRAWRKIRARQLEREPNCRECGAPAAEVDHIVRLADGGSFSDPGNQRALEGARPAGPSQGLPRQAFRDTRGGQFFVSSHGGVTSRCRLTASLSTSPAATPPAAAVRAPRPLRGVPTGRGGGAALAVRHHPAADR